MPIDNANLAKIKLKENMGRRRRVRKGWTGGVRPGNPDPGDKVHPIYKYPPGTKAPITPTAPTTPKVTKPTPPTTPGLTGGGFYNPAERVGAEEGNAANGWIPNPGTKVPRPSSTAPNPGKMISSGPTSRLESEAALKYWTKKRMQNAKPLTSKPDAQGRVYA